jgi:hypothetical protein
MIFYYHMIYSPETDKQVRYCSRLQSLQSLRLQQINMYNNTYSVHDNVLMLCQARLLCLLASYERLPVSTSGYQLLISSPSPPGGSGSPTFPIFMVASFPPWSMHTLLPLSVTGTMIYFLCLSDLARESWSGLQYRRDPVTTVTKSVLITKCCSLVKKDRRSCVISETILETS